jgi:hypothetical protein
LPLIVFHHFSGFNSRCGPGAAQRWATILAADGT